ncbi:hypothetical protein C2S51_032231 [Perilla frutescens var. frutescens]|nr:hypothetical protein C2S51_032231 [Perilla frutescens var. frutescens]
MEFEDTGDVMEKKISFGLSVADEKIKLIDILSEDDDFLVASPFCDHSLQASISEIERMEQESRPSFLRRSLAWDSAFFNSSGVLDADELSFINNGFRHTEASLLPANHEVRNRRSESESTPNEVGFSADWFEIDPSIFESNSSKALNVIETSPKPRLKQNVQSSKKVDRSCRNKMKSDRTSIGKSIDVQREEKLKKESEARRRPSNKNLSGKSNLNMGKNSITSSLGQGLIMQEKSANQSSSTLSSAKSSSMFSSTASSLSKRKTELKKAQNSASLQNSKISRHSERKKGMGNISVPTHSTCSVNEQISSLPANSTRHFPSSASLSSPVHKQRRSTDSKDVKEASNLQRSLQSPLICAKQYGLLSAKSIRPSGLRPPSPLLRFFDESTSPMNCDGSRSRKLPQKVISSATAKSPCTQFSKVSPNSSASSRTAPARKKLKNPFSESAKNIKTPETVLISTLATADASIDAEATDQQKGKKELSFSVNHVENLCRNFKAFDLESDKTGVGKRCVPACSVLKQENQLPNSSRPCTRTPLAEKTTNRNSGGAFALAMKPKTEQLLRRASSVRYG